MPRQIIHYQPHLKQLARQLRNNCTKAEIYLWLRLKNKQILGFDFHRQKPLLSYIVDFYCHELNLAIEIDGEIHEMKDILEKDKIRQTEIEMHGVSFLRFTNDAICNNLDYVIEQIKKWILERDILA
jgi:very-short-patch-repair endonuclease